MAGSKLTSEYVETDRDRWAEAEARSCDLSAAEFERCGREWLAKPLHADNAQMAMVCAIKAEAWRQLADRLRRPTAIGRERAALAAQQKGEDHG